jgi:hypothetical protein
MENESLGVRQDALDFFSILANSLRSVIPCRGPRLGLNGFVNSFYVMCGLVQHQRAHATCLKNAALITKVFRTGKFVR